MSNQGMDIPNVKTKYRVLGESHMKNHMKSHMKIIPKFWQKIFTQKYHSNFWPKMLTQNLVWKSHMKICWSNPFPKSYQNYWGPPRPVLHDPSKQDFRSFGYQLPKITTFDKDIRVIVHLDQKFLLTSNFRVWTF